MKKLVFMFVALVGLSFASCGNTTNGASSTNDTDTVSVDTIDSIGIDSVNK